MRSRIRENALAGAASVAALCVIGWLALYGWAWTDYDDEARPAFDAIVHGQLLQFLQRAPAYGGSLVMRAPFVLVTRLWGGGELAIFRAAAVPCLLASAVLGVWLVARMRGLQRSRAARALALALCVANPITLHALELGHPEELLGAVLCVAAVLAALGDRPIWAGVLLGLAFANKEWAILATGPVLLALPHGRWRALLAAGAVAGVILAPLLLAGLSGLSGLSGLASPASSKSSAIFQPWQLWWFLGSHGHVVKGLWGDLKVGYRTPPGWIEAIAHPLIVALALPLTLLCAWQRGRRGARRGGGRRGGGRRGGALRSGARRPANDALLLLMLLLALRCVLDPWNNSYYPLPFLIALVVWETLTFDRLPVLALAGSLAVWFALQWTPQSGLNISADMQSLIFLVVAIPAVIANVVALYAPGLGKRVAGRMAVAPSSPRLAGTP